ncbi:hypothetical protein EV182_000172 [Spiromyces aspiralis]|uniref:Uncharacterized protein n=1 Tax=Spiromyces aspiralis TaxID=68401 RepID=A0ACC1HL51_9FUNG|nr:hypothetical protein EV182_000172 [Spiromyces aspiralis]
MSNDVASDKHPETIHKSLDVARIARVLRLVQSKLRHLKRQVVAEPSLFVREDSCASPSLSVPADVTTTPSVTSLPSSLSPSSLSSTKESSSDQGRGPHLMSPGRFVKRRSQLRAGGRPKFTYKGYKEGSRATDPANAVAVCLPSPPTPTLQSSLREAVARTAWLMTPQCARRVRRSLGPRPQLQPMTYQLAQDVDLLSPVKKKADTLYEIIYNQVKNLWGASPTVSGSGNGSNNNSSTHPLPPLLQPAKGRCLPLKVLAAFKVGEILALDEMLADNVEELLEFYESVPGDLRRFVLLQHIVLICLREFPTRDCAKGLLTALYPHGAQYQMAWVCQTMLPINHNGAQLLLPGKLMLYYCFALRAGFELRFIGDLCARLRAVINAGNLHADQFLNLLLPEQGQVDGHGHASSYSRWIIRMHSPVCSIQMLALPLELVASAIHSLVSYSGDGRGGRLRGHFGCAQPVDRLLILLETISSLLRLVFGYAWPSSALHGVEFRQKAAVEAISSIVDSLCVIHRAHIAASEQLQGTRGPSLKGTMLGKVTLEVFLAKLQHTILSLGLTALPFLCMFDADGEVVACATRATDIACIVKEHLSYAITGKSRQLLLDRCVAQPLDEAGASPFLWLDVAQALHAMGQADQAGQLLNHAWRQFSLVKARWVAFRAYKLAWTRRYMLGVQQLCDKSLAHGAAGRQSRGSASTGHMPPCDPALLEDMPSADTTDLDTLYSKFTAYIEVLSYNPDADGNNVFGPNAATSLAMPMPARSVVTVKNALRRLYSDEGEDVRDELDWPLSPIIMASANRPTTRRNLLPSQLSVPRHAVPRMRRLAFSADSTDASDDSSDDDYEYTDMDDNDEDDDRGGESGASELTSLLFPKLPKSRASARDPTQLPHYIVSIAEAIANHSAPIQGTKDHEKWVRHFTSMPAHAQDLATYHTVRRLLGNCSLSTARPAGGQARCSDTYPPQRGADVPEGATHCIVVVPRRKVNVSVPIDTDLLEPPDPESHSGSESERSLQDCELLGLAVGLESDSKENDGPINYRKDPIIISRLRSARRRNGGSDWDCDDSNDDDDDDDNNYKTESEEDELTFNPMSPPHRIVSNSLVALKRRLSHCETQRQISGMRSSGIPAEIREIHKRMKQSGQARTLRWQLQRRRPTGSVPSDDHL